MLPLRVLLTCMQDYNGKITYTAFAPLFVIPTLLVVVPRCPARFRLPLFGGVVSVYGSFSLFKYFSSEG